MSSYGGQSNYDENLDELSTLLSSTVSFLETEHARLRRKQRCIDTKDLKAAIKHGKCAPHFWGTKNGRKIGRPGIMRYTYKDIVYIVDTNTGKEVTCYAIPVKLDLIKLPNGMERFHHQAAAKVRDDLDCWTSNTVMVIDTSGSMRTSDMWGTRNRLKSVWFCIALDYVAQRLESGTATYTDVISVVTMGARPKIILKDVPTTWFLYNKMVELYSSRELSPEGPGNFLPSLTTAKELLTRNSNASCAAALIFLSDGAPSDGGKDRTRIIESVESLAKTFGRRLTFNTIGIGDYEEFSVLQRMVDAAKDYGVVAEFKLPSMSSTALGQTFTSVATSLTETQTEMTDTGTMTQRKVRNVIRESRSRASQKVTEVTDEEFYFYGKSDVRRLMYNEEKNSSGKLQPYYTHVELQHPSAKYVAFARGPFGEGAERFAFRFYEVAANRRTVLGVPMVAKESRMILDTERGKSMIQIRQEFVNKFVMTQQMARKIADEFNTKMRSHKGIHKETPLVSFLDCSIYELDDKIYGKSVVLVEKKLDHTKWYKWNSNNGMVNGIRKESLDCSRRAIVPKGNGLNDIMENLAKLDLGKIEEGSEEEDSNSEGSDENEVRNTSGTLYTPSQVAQAFSHFSYEASGRKRIVCDLQGVYDEEKNLLEFSDPVIHYFNPDRTDKRGIHGRTDRGEAGIRDFFKTHSCEEQGNLCSLLTRGFKSAKKSNRHHHHERSRSSSQYRNPYGARTNRNNASQFCF